MKTENGMNNEYHAVKDKFSCSMAGCSDRGKAGNLVFPDGTRIRICARHWAGLASNQAALSAGDYALEAFAL